MNILAKWLLGKILCEKEAGPLSYPHYLRRYIRIVDSICANRLFGSYDVVVGLSRPCFEIFRSVAISSLQYKDYPYLAEEKLRNEDFNKWFNQKVIDLLIRKIKILLLPTCCEQL